MPAITSWIAVAGVASAIGGVVQSSAAASAALKDAAKQAKDAKAAAFAKKPSEETEADIKLVRTDKDLKRGKGSKAKRDRDAASAGGLTPPSASKVGGL